MGNYYPHPVDTKPRRPSEKRAGRRRYAERKRHQHAHHPFFVNGSLPVLAATFDTIDDYTCDLIEIERVAARVRSEEIA